MYERLLEWLRCPVCGGRLEAVASVTGAGEIAEGDLRCPAPHEFAIRRGVPRMLPRPEWGFGHDRRTQESFDAEWRPYSLGDQTWQMSVEERVQYFLLDSMRQPPKALEGKLMLDAGCGNGTQSVAYSALGLEVVALDLSTGVDHGHAFRGHHKEGRPERVHFVQGDLRSPPFAPGSFDLIHSAGVLHHTPDTEESFRALCPLLRADGAFFVWLYGREPVVTPVVDAIRALTTRISPRRFAQVARVLAPAFMLFTATLSAAGMRHYGRLSRKEATMALIDIFGSPYAHTHSFEEVERWFYEEGFDEVWRSNDSRRGFGAWGRRDGRHLRSAGGTESKTR